MGQRRGLLWIAVGLVLALVAGLLAFSAMQQALAAPSTFQEVPKAQVVVAARWIPLRQVIDVADIAVKEIEADSLPEGVVTRVADAVGKITTAEIAAGEVLVAHRLADPSVKGENLAFTMDEDKVLMAFPATDLMSTVRVLKPGDRVDILFSLASGEGDDAEDSLVTFNSLQNTEISAIVMPPETDAKGPNSRVREPVKPQAILLALDPQDALTLKHLKDAGGIFDLVLRAPTNKQLSETKPVDIDYLRDRYHLAYPSQ